MKRACNNCKIITSGEKCPICQSTDLSDSWKGRMYIFDVERSEIAKKLEIKLKGEYAVKTK